MKSKQRAVITIETRKLTVIRVSHTPINHWCEVCATEVLMVTPDRAAAMQGVTTREIYRRIESGNLHTIESTQGSLLICCPSA